MHLHVDTQRLFTWISLISSIAQIDGAVLKAPFQLHMWAGYAAGTKPWSSVSEYSRPTFASLSQSYISFGHLNMWQWHIEPSQAVLCVCSPQCITLYLGCVVHNSRLCGREGVLHRPAQTAQLISSTSSSIHTIVRLLSPSIRVPMESNDLQRRGSDREARDLLALCIESLPVEIQRQIMLCLPTLGSLGAIIRASPVFHSLFQSEPKNFIAHCLINILGDTFLDACTARAAMQDDFQKERRDAMKLGHETSIIWPFLESYRKKVQQLPCNSWIHSISLPEAIEMAMFHSSTVEPLVEEYTSWALANLGASGKPTDLSRTERMRIQRAMYRFQIVCDVFGNKPKDGNVSDQRPRQLGCLRFLSSYEPWEIEEILCVHTFLQEQYQKKLLEVSDNLNSIPWRSIVTLEQALDFGRVRTLKNETKRGVCAGHADTVDRHKRELAEFPRQPRPTTSRVRVAHPRSRRAGGYPAHQHALRRVGHVARRHHRQHRHAREMGEVIFGPRPRPGRWAPDTVSGRRPGLAAAGMGPHLGRDVQQLVWYLYPKATSPLGLYHVGCAALGGDGCYREAYA